MSVAQPIFYLLAGPNGAGKSSLYRAVVAEQLIPPDALIRDAKKSGFAVVLLVVCLDDPQRLVARVQQRVLEGGHNVPSDRILARYPRTLENLTQAVRLADMAMLYDTGSMDDDGLCRPARVAVCRGQDTKLLTKTLPNWAKQVLGGDQPGQM